MWCAEESRAGTNIARRAHILDAVNNSHAGRLLHELPKSFCPRTPSYLSLPFPLWQNQFPKSRLCVAIVLGESRGADRDVQLKGAEPDLSAATYQIHDESHTIGNALRWMLMKKCVLFLVLMKYPI